MKKVALLTILLVVAASAAITIEFSGNPPSKVGEQATLSITTNHTSVDLAVDSGGTKHPWISVSTGSAGPNPIEITHPGQGLRVYASKLGDEAYSEEFNVAIGDDDRWQIIAPGEAEDPGSPDGKSGSASVSAGVDTAYGVNLCDVWFNVTNPSPTGYSITTDDPYGRVMGDNVELRTAGTWNVVISGGAYKPDTSRVEVNPGSATRLLLICNGETPDPGDALTTNQPGKTGDPNDAVVLQDYIIDVYAVDAAWNQVTSYTGTGAVAIKDSQNRTIGTSSNAMSGGHVSVTVQFQDVNTQGEYIGADESGGLSTSYDTKVVVQPAVTEVNARIEPAEVLLGVEADLIAEPVVVDEPVGAGYALYISPLVGMGTGDYSKLEYDSIMYTDVNGFASSTVSANDTGTYYLKVDAKSVADTVSFTVKELEGLLVRPNPYVYERHSAYPISFDYKVEQIGVGGASEIMLLVADPYGNIVYKATYDINEPQTNPGKQTITWDGMNSKGVRVASGMYQALVKVTLINGSTSVIKKNFMVIW